jgi:hypothetical protein
LLDVVTALPDPTRCADDATTTWPHDAPAQDALWSIRRALVRADLLGRTGHLVRPVQVLGDAEEHALTLDSYAVLAEVEVAVGDAERRAGRTASAGSILSEAHAQAMQTHHLDAAAAAATSLVLVHVAMPARARAWADDATAAILEGGDSPTAAARLAAAVGTVAAQAGPDNGVFADDEVVGALEAAILRFDGEPHGEVARSLAVLADIAESRSRWEEAEAYRRRALDAVLAFAGPRHPDVADAHVRLAAVLVRRGNADAAGNALTAAEAIAGDGTVPSTPNRTELARRIAAVRADLEAAPDR